MSADPTDVDQQLDDEANRASEARQQVLFKAEDLRAVMRVGPGRRVMWRVLEITQPFSVAMGADVRDMCFMNGRRSVGVELMDEMKKHCLAEYRLMEDEALKAKSEKRNA